MTNFLPSSFLLTFGSSLNLTGADLYEWEALQQPLTGASMELPSAFVPVWKVAAIFNRVTNILW